MSKQLWDYYFSAKAVKSQEGSIGEPYVSKWVYDGRHWQPFIEMIKHKKEPMSKWEDLTFVCTTGDSHEVRRYGGRP